MKKKLLMLSVVSILILTGCSEKNAQLQRPVSNKVFYNQNSTVASKFEEAVAFQNKREYARAIEAYDAIINHYRGREDKGVLSSVYINKFECALVSNQGYEEQDLTDFLRRFGNDKKELMQFELLYILDTAKTRSMDAKMEQWVSRYRGERLDGWTFKYIEDWVVRMENATVRNRLIRYVSIFKKFL